VQSTSANCSTGCSAAAKPEYRPDSMMRAASTHRQSVQTWRACLGALLPPAHQPHRTLLTYKSRKPCRARGHSRRRNGSACGAPPRGCAPRRWVCWPVVLAARQTRCACRRPSSRSSRRSCTQRTRSPRRHPAPPRWQVRQNAMQCVHHGGLRFVKFLTCFYSRPDQP